MRLQIDLALDQGKEEKMESIEKVVTKDSAEQGKEEKKEGANNSFAELFSRNNTVQAMSESASAEIVSIDLCKAMESFNLQNTPDHKRKLAMAAVTEGRIIRRRRLTRKSTSDDEWEEMKQQMKDCPNLMIHFGPPCSKWVPYWPRHSQLSLQ